MDYRRLGTTDLRVSVIAMGCWGISGEATWGPQDEQDSSAAIHAALDAGVNFFDTAELYGAGHSEEVLGRALKGKRNQAVIATKVSNKKLGASDLREACEESLQRLQTDHIDLYQIHWPSRDVPFEETAATLAQLHEEGKIRAAGVSNFGPQDLSAFMVAMKVPALCASNQLPYSLVFRAIEFEIIPQCVEKQVGVLCYSPLMQALLTGKFASANDVPDGRARTRLFSSNRPLARHHEDGHEEELFAAIREIQSICKSIGQPMSRVALAWLLQQKGVAAVIAGARNAAQSQENARAADLKLDAAVLKQLSQTTEGLKQAMGPNADLWETESRMR